LSSVSFQSPVAPYTHRSVRLNPMGLMC
jgi:hypothetical protein